VRTLFFVFSILFLNSLSFGQIELKGVVIDAKTKEALPYVNYAVGTSQGGTTDDSGRFFITVNSKTDSVIFSYIGYKDESLKKRFFKRDSIIVKLHLESFMLEEFTVKAKKGKIPKDTAAIRIFRNVVANKKDNRPKSFSSYQYEEYLKTVASLYNIKAKIAKMKILKAFKFILENQDTTADGTRFIPLILKETISDHYVNKDPKKNKEVVKAQKTSGIEQLRFSELLDVAFDEVEVYDNQTQVIGKTFLLPFADGGLALYNYYVIDSVKVADTTKAIDTSKFIYRKRTVYFDKIVYDTSVIKQNLTDSSTNAVINDTATIDSLPFIYTTRIDTSFIKDSLNTTDTIVVRDSVMIYNLAFVPKSKSDLLFNGKAKIHGGDYAIMNIDLGIDKRSNLNFINDFSLSQGFENVDGNWFKNMESRSTNISYSKKRKAKSVRIARYMHRKNIIINQPIADTILKDIDQVLVKNYRKKPDSFWLASRHDTLSKSEAKVYILIDSLKNTKIYKALAGMGSFFASGYYKTKVIDIGNAYQLVSWNDLEGVRFRLNLKNNWRIGEWVNWKVYAAYGLKDKRFKYGLELSTKLPDKKFKHYHAISASYRDDYQRFTLEGTGQDYDFVFNSLLRRRSITDLIYLKDAKLNYYRDWGKSINTTIGFNYRNYKTIPGRIEFMKTTDLGGGIIDTVYHPSFQVFAPSINFTATPGSKFLQTSRKKQFLKGNLPRFTFNYSFSVKSKISDFNFHKLTLLVEERLPSPIGHTNIRLAGSKLFGSAPYPLLTILPGNQSFLYDNERFTSMLENEFIADQHLSLMIEHHFDGFFFNKIPLWRKLGFREIFETKLAVASLDKSKVSFSDLPTGLNGLNGFYAEIGFGIENIAKFLRVDFNWRLTQLDNPNVKKFRWTLYFVPNF
jgi:hypothetical protein